MRYHEPHDLDEALDLLARCGGDALPVAGGIEVALALAEGDPAARPACLVGLRRVAELEGLRAAPGGGLELGALTTHRQAERSPLVRHHCPALPEVFAGVGTVRIRNQGTIGGNVAQGDAAFGPPVAFLALGATVELAAAGGRRRVPFEDFAHGHGTTARRSDELVVAIHLPPAPGRRLVFHKHAPAGAPAAVTVAAAADVGTDGTCALARLALGGLAPAPVRLRAVERALTGAPLSPQALADATALVPAALAEATGGAAGRSEVGAAAVVVERTLRRLAEGTQA